jgi:hypothetical protein
VFLVVLSTVISIACGPPDKLSLPSERERVPLLMGPLSRQRDGDAVYARSVSGRLPWA